MNDCKQVELIFANSYSSISEHQFFGTGAVTYNVGLSPSTYHTISEYLQEM
jgi:hypothetical protein